MKFIVEQKNSGGRLDRFLQERLKDLSRSQIQKMIKAGEVLVNSKEVTAHHFLKVGEEIQVKGKKAKGKNESQNSKVSGPRFKVEIVAEEKDFVVVNKPAGMVVHHDSSHKENTLVDWLIEKYPEIKKVGDNESRPGIVHRLDKDVSGLMVVARTPEMFEYLKKQFQDRKTEKEYLALVHGMVSKDEDQIKRSIGRAKGETTMRARSQSGDKDREAVTQYKVEKRWKNFTLLRVKILTGRTHQIRVHLKAIGHSLVGDELYVTRDVKRKKQQEKLGRVWLVACKLGFRDLDGEWRKFQVKMPSELEKFLKKIR